MSRLKFASIGDVCVDVYSQEKREVLGGTAYNVAVAAGKLGTQTSLISAIGTDSYSQRYLVTTKQLGINTTHLRQMPGSTSNVTVTLDSQKRPTFLKWNLGVLKDYSLSLSDLDFVGQHKIARATMLIPLTQLFNQFAKRNLPETLKVGEFAGGSEYSCPIETLNHYKRGLDIYIRSVSASREAELTFLADFAQKNKKIVVATLGSRGSVVFTADKTYRQKAVELHEQVVDTTGAGDTYTAHFLIVYATTKNIAVAMQKATQATAKSITHKRFTK